MSTGCFASHSERDEGAAFDEECTHLGGLQGTKERGLVEVVGGHGRRVALVHQVPRQRIARALVGTEKAR